MGKQRLEILQAPFAVFDMDGTLIDSNKQAVVSLEKFFSAYGLKADPCIIEQAKTMGMETLFQSLSECTHGEAGPDEVREFLLNDSIELYRKVKLKPYAKMYVRSRRKIGIRMCVASATNRELMCETLDRLRMTEYFDFLISVEDIGHIGKEKPDLFLECARRFGERDSAMITVYEDSLMAMKSAKSVGMNVVAVYDEVQKEEIEAKKISDLYIYGWDELLGNCEV